MKTYRIFLFSVFTGTLFLAHATIADIGNTTIAKWKDNKKGAYTLRFDDSMMSHKDHTVPNLVKRGLVGSFFLNPATNRYGYGIDVWESQASRNGIEICPHTMNHIGAGDFDEADYEIGESFRTIWNLNPPDKSKLYPFNRGGGTEWPDGYRKAIQSNYPVADYSTEALRYNGGDNQKELIAFAEKAMQDDAWHIVLTHGTGPDLEWLGFEVSNFEALLDYLESVNDKMWVGNAGDIYKYVTERKSAEVNIIKSDNGSIRLNLSSEVEPELFDYPLSLITEVPDTWEYCKVIQGDIIAIYPVVSSKVMYEAIPNRGEIQLLSSNMDTTPPGQVLVNDGTGQDIDSSPHTNMISANWGSALDEESGITRYWYRIGTSPGGGEILDWIDNGRVRSFSTSRTNLALVRGEKYYVTVKAVNGVGLYTESISDGFTVNTIPDYISFSENFDSGYLSQWTERQTRNGSDKNIIYLTERASRNEGLGMQCHLQDLQRGTPYLSKDNVSREQEVFTRFYLKLSSDFHFTPESGNLQILELQDTGGNFVAQVSLGFKSDIGYHVYASTLDNTGYQASIPGSRGDYPLSYIPVKKDEWIRIDLRTKADEKKGGAELWVNGVREGCIANRFTDGLAVRSMRIGILNLDENSVNGDLYIDDVSVSDSFLR
jgi:hypothetical protein